jgi:kynurenine formamidase
MKKYLPLLLLFACNSATEPETLNSQLSKGKWIDLSYDFSNETLYWPTAQTFRFDTVFEGTTGNGYYYAAYNYCAAEHGGTHLDAPVHFARGKWSTDQVPIENLTGEAVVIDISGKALKDPDYQLSPADIQSWEETNGNIPDSCILMIRTGYGAHYPDAKKYLGTDERGAGAVPKLRFPAIHPNAATWLVNNRKIKAVGIDVASVDYGQSKEFQTHRILYEQNIPGFENVANMDKLPVKGAYIIALPMKIKNGSGGPLRIVAWVRD